MEKNTFTSEDYFCLIEPDLASIRSVLSSISKKLMKIRREDDIPAIKTRIALLVQEMEKLAVLGRSLPMFQSLEEPEAVESIMTDIQISSQGDAVIIKIPLLLPKTRSNKANKKYLVGMLHNVFKFYFRDRKKYQEHVVIWFEYQYRKREGKQGFRDHDNIESKIVKDLLAPYLVFDDGPIYCDDFHSSKTGDCDATYIHVIPRSIFANYYLDRVSSYESI